MTKPGVYTCNRVVTSEIGMFLQQPHSFGLPTTHGIVLPPMSHASAQALNVSRWRLPDSSKENGIRLQFSVHVGTKRRCVPDRVISIASVVETETAIESGPEMVVARGSDQGLRYIDLGHRPCGEADPQLRLPGSVAAGLFAVSRGASILRVHNVAETIQALRVWQALTT